MRDRKARTQREHSALLAERQRIKERFAALYRHVFQVCGGLGTSDLVFVRIIGFGDIWFGVRRFGDI